MAVSVRCVSKYSVSDIYGGVRVDDEVNMILLEDVLLDASTFLIFEA